MREMPPWGELHKKVVRILTISVAVILFLFPHLACGRKLANQPSTAVFFGDDIGPNAQVTQCGAVLALNGDLTREGVLLRGLGMMLV